MNPVWLFGLVLAALLPSSLSHRLDILAGNDMMLVVGLDEQRLSKLSWAFSLKQVAREHSLTLIERENVSWLKPEEQRRDGSMDTLLYTFSLLGETRPLQELPQSVQSWVAEMLCEEDSPLARVEELFVEVVYSPYVVVRHKGAIVDIAFLQPSSREERAYPLFFIALAEEGKVYRTRTGVVSFFGTMPNLRDVELYALWLHAPDTAYAERAAETFRNPFGGISKRVVFKDADMSPAQKDALYSAMEIAPLPEYTYEFIPNIAVRVSSPKVPIVREFCFPVAP